MDTKVKDLVSSAIGKVHELSDADTIIGKPIKAEGNITIIPVSKISYGFAAGGTDLPSKSDKELFGGGSGGGVSIQPIAFIVVTEGDVKLLEIGAGSSQANAIINAVPDLISKIQTMFSKKKDNDDDSQDIEIPETESAAAVKEPEIEKVEINTDGFDF